MAGIVKGIWLKKKKGAPMEAQEKITLVKNKGIENNADQGGDRQITIIEEEVWKSAAEELGSNLDPVHRRANLLVSNTPLKNSKGKILKIGNCKIKIIGEAKPCENMDAVLPGLKDKLYDDWKAGAYGIIINDGEIALGDEVQFISE